MRLTQIKLAGFKSFVDPTSIAVPGQLVGIVGPNGCGKSNVIDAVRWVLGESRASALRGDSMQDVIFNGSAQRKPVARASVELMFDNSLGKAAGQWSQYAEIAVKRVLTREGESLYYINNSHVRRRDIQDIFMGTGLGPRAYAIIEQGMISRIIEAKPEDLRVFLEEAAGISRYKERRRETEHRLHDTRENLARVADICQELSLQIDKLDQQAKVAMQFKELQGDMQRKQNLLWLLRKTEADNEAQRHAREIERAGNELEAETARLREIEKRLEEVRSAHYEAGDTLGSAQGELYAVNAEVQRLETEIRYIGESRTRIENQIAQLAAHSAQWQQQAGDLHGALALWQGRQGGAGQRLQQAHERVAAEAAKLPEADQDFRALQARLAEERAALAHAEQALRIEQTHISHADKTLQGLTLRQERLIAEHEGLAKPDAAAIEEQQRQIADLAEELARKDAQFASQLRQLPELENARRTAQEKLDAQQREQAGLEARLATLKQVQDQVEGNAQIQEWLIKHRLESLPRLWQQVRVEAGWETAFEAVLREKLHAVEVSQPELLQRLLEDAPPAKLSVYAATAAAPDQALDSRRPLVSLLGIHDEAVRGVMQDWLHRVYAVENAPGAGDRQALPQGVILVSREGHQFSRSAVSFHAPDPGDTGILARQREVEDLSAQLREREDALRQSRTEQHVVEAALGGHNQRLATLRQETAALKQRVHEQQLESLRLSQGLERFQERSRQIQLELDEIARQQETEWASQAAAEASLAQHQQAMEAATGRVAATLQAYSKVEQALNMQRQALQQAEHEDQEALFYYKECSSKINEINNSIKVILEQSSAAAGQLEQLRTDLAGQQDADLRQRLQTQLELRVQREQSLGVARSSQEDLAQGLRSAEEERLVCEQQLEPLRNRINELRLKEQAARLNKEQYASQLFEAGADEEALAAMLEKGMRPNALQAEINRLVQSITDLGAVNMAALEELQASRERKGFLDAQAADLNMALETLEAAIRRIDRETREMLQQTFDAVNGHFGQMFPSLFGGGEAHLVMTGEEILDAGVQVIAQPPGKKTSTIHLLSGGEKALTALALVFSMFQLNPAPFCLLDEVDAPLDDPNTERFCDLVKRMSADTQFLYISHNKITMEMAAQLVGVTMQESGVSRVVAVDIEEALRMKEELAA
ncbi:MAG: chromosome segregation protein SMC [Betaproteobacteria bacterium]|nr:chromosome segregation protein SMC [Betaproteobacteria bacterium]